MTQEQEDILTSLNNILKNINNTIEKAIIMKVEIIIEIKNITKIIAEE